MNDGALAFLLDKDKEEVFKETGKSGQDDSATNTQEDLSISECIVQYKYASEIEGKAEKTLKQYDYVFGKFLDYLGGDKPIEVVTANQIRGFIGKLRSKDLSKSTISIHYRVLRAFFNWLVGEGLLESSPLENIKEPKTPNKYPRVLNSKQTERLIAVAEGNNNTWAGYRNYTIILCFLDMGLRLNELVEAKMKNLEFRERTLKVHGKGAKDRTVYFGWNTYKTLRRWSKMRKDKGKVYDGTIFISQNGDKLRKRHVQKIVTRTQKEASLEDLKVSPHVLRHTAATLAVQNGMQPFALKRFFGWESIKTAMRYVHMNDKAVKKSFEQSSPIDNIGEKNNAE